MTRSPAVSVITCFYNAERFLGETIESVLGQTFGDFEYLLVNDASTDGSRDIARTYARDPRVRLLDTPENVGAYAAANLALAQAQGEYVARLDADDVALPDRLIHQVEAFARESEVGLVAMGYQVVDERGRTVGAPQTPGRSCAGLRWTLLFWNCIPHSTAMYRRSVAARLGDYGTSRYAQDYDLWSRMSFVSEIVQLDHVGVRYRRTAAGITATHTSEQVAVARTVSQRAIARILKTSADDPAVTTVVARHYGVYSASATELEPLRRFVMSLVDPFCDAFSYGADERARIRRVAGDHAYWIALRREREAPLRSLRVYLRLATRSRHRPSWRRIVASGARLILRKRGMELALAAKGRIGG